MSVSSPTFLYYFWEITAMDARYNHDEYKTFIQVGEFALSKGFPNPWNPKSKKPLGRNQVMALMRELGFLNRENIPYGHYSEYLRISLKPLNSCNIPYKPVPLITPRGQDWLEAHIRKYIARKLAEVANESNC